MSEYSAVEEPRYNCSSFLRVDAGWSSAQVVTLQGAGRPDCTNGHTAPRSSAVLHMQPSWVNLRAFAGRTDICSIIAIRTAGRDQREKLVSALLGALELRTCSGERSTAIMTANQLEYYNREQSAQSECHGICHQCCVLRHLQPQMHRAFVVDDIARYCREGTGVEGSRRPGR